MSFENEILLAYHSTDDEPIGGSSRGWVSNFHRFLSTLLEQISGQKPKIRLVTEADTSLQVYSESMVLITLFSKSFLKSEILVQGIHTFASNAKKQGGLVTDGLSKLFKVIKFPLDVDDLLPEYSDILTYDFYQIDPLTGEPQEFRRFFGNDAERSYWMKLVDMAYDIYQIQNKVEEEAREEEDDQSDKNKTIYLANTGVDMIIQRDIVKRELLRHGYKVLPNHSLPKEVNALEDVVKRDLTKCCLSIHLIGEDYGYKPKGSDLSVVDLQNRIAAQYTRDILAYNEKSDAQEKFSRLIWLSPDLKNVSERQKIFIEDLKSDAASLDEAEVLQIQLQELKSIIREELVTGGRFKTKDVKLAEDIGDSGSIVYVIFDKIDREKSQPIVEYLSGKGLNVVTSLYDGDLVDLRYLHQENLRRCDASLIYYGGSSKEWIKTKLQDILKAPGFGRVKPLKATAVYLEDKSNFDENNLRNNDAMILGDGEFSPQSIEPFLTKLEIQ
ncbi:MAG: hypothetical protein RIG77_14110 [Cyclobacteriaceae bacterium]